MISDTLLELMVNIRDVKKQGTLFSFRYICAWNWLIKTNYDTLSGKEKEEDNSCLICPFHVKEPLGVTDVFGSEWTCTYNRYKDIHLL